MIAPTLLKFLSLRYDLDKPPHYLDGQIVLNLPYH